MERYKIMILITFILCLIGFDTHAANIFAKSCSVVDVQNAINSARDADTVLVPAGNCTWGTAVSISNKTITLRGAGSGTGGTKITYGGTNHTLINAVSGTKTGKMEIFGFWLVGGDENYWDGTALQFGGPVGWKKLRIHDMVFDGNKPWSIKGDGPTYGVIDNCTFKGSAAGIMLYGRGDTDWTTSLALGTSDFFFIENNTFDWDDYYGSTGSPTFDLDGGGRVVFRNNIVKYGMFETHDFARSGLVSGHSYEIYNNHFWTDTEKWKGLDIASGTGVIWGNTFTGPYTYPIGGMDYKSFDPRNAKLCDGTDPQDQNTPGQTGWRCKYQIGSHNFGANAVGYPLYIWNNIVVDGSGPSGMFVTAGENHVQEGRDFINNGTTPKPGYTPYIYPHPLVSGPPPKIPLPPKIVDIY